MRVWFAPQPDGLAQLQFAPWGEAEHTARSIDALEAFSAGLRVTKSGRLADHVHSPRSSAVQKMVAVRRLAGLPTKFSIAFWSWTRARHTAWKLYADHLI